MRCIQLLITAVLGLLLFACGWGGNNYNTIDDLQEHDVDLANDIPVDNSRKKAIYSYREILVDEDQEKDAPEVLRRLGDLRLEENEELSTNDPTDTIDEDKYTTLVIDYRETIELYEHLLDVNSDYELNDVVLYQLSRAYESADDRENMLRSLDRLVTAFPESGYYAEAQFRRGEILFVDKKYRQAVSAYTEVVNKGSEGRFYQHALYKQGWCHFKLMDYDIGLHSFIGLIDTMIIKDVDEDYDKLTRPQKELLDDSLRALALSYGYLGGAAEISDYFDNNGRRTYEVMIYDRLGQQFFEKRRYSDAANTYREFVKTNQFNSKAPDFQIKAIETFKKGNFPSEVLAAKKQFVDNYQLNSEYWAHNKIDDLPHIVEYLKTSIVDLSKFYHSIAQKSKKKPDYIEATHWYRVYIDSFPDDQQTAKMNFLLADIWFEIKEYRNAVTEFEVTAYDYPQHEQSSEAGYAALVAYNDWLNATKEASRKQTIKSQQIDSTFKFANKFPQHPQAPVALTKASEDLFSQKDYMRAIEASTLLVEKFPDAELNLRKSAWTVKAHSTFEISDYASSELAYQQAIILTTGDNSERKKLEDKLAASIYKQGEASKLAGDYEQAIKHFLRVGEVVPDTEIRASAQYDAAALLLQTEQWKQAATVLEDFRKRFPKHKEQSEVTRKLALAYEKDQQNLLAAREYERISQDKSNDTETRRTSALVAADIYTKEKDIVRAIDLYQDYIKQFPVPHEPAMESRQHLVNLYQGFGDIKQAKYWRQEIIKTEAAARSASTVRMKYIAANASLQLAIPSYTIYHAARLKIPLEKSLKTKKLLMEKALAAFELASAYKVQEVTTAATHYSALIYHDFSRALMQSDRPGNLSGEELAQYELLLEEQAFPFEEQAIELYELNANRTVDGVYNKWIKQSIHELGELMPARYAKQEESESYVETIY